MEVKLRKRFSLPSWMMASVLALGMNGFAGQDCNAYVTYNNASTNIAAGTYGVQGEDGTYLGVDGVLQPGANPDPGMLMGEDLYQFTGTNFTIGEGGGNTIFAWKTAFGTRGNGDNITMNIVGGTNIFDNQGIYIGSRAEGAGGNAVLNISGGNNIFTQRVMIGGDGQGAGGVTGKSNVNISGGLNIFTYDKKFDWQEKVVLNDSKIYTVGSYTGEYNKYLGAGVFAPGDDSTEYHYESVNCYNYYRNYYGVFISAIGTGTGDGTMNTQGANLTISGGKNVFNVATYVGGGYDLTPYGSVDTSSDDNDVVWGGTNSVNFTGGFTAFNARTFFGAAGSTTDVNFSGRSTTYFNGLVIADNMDKAKADMELDVPGSISEYRNNYRGMDLPYVFFGGKDVTQFDAKNENAPVGQQAVTTVNINGANSSMTTVHIATTAFFGGADERWLAGDQYEYDASGNLVPRFQFREEETAYGDASRNATRRDTGVATVNMNSGKMHLEYVNTTAIVKERNKANWNYGTVEGPELPGGMPADTFANDTVYEPIAWQNRYEQVRLIGAAPGSTFNANGGRIEFEVAVHEDAKNTEAYKSAVADGYTGYFTDNGTISKNFVTAQTQNPMLLESAMIAFDTINVSANTDIVVGGIGRIMARSELAPAPGQPQYAVAGVNEFYTNPTFVDTTNAQFINETTVDLANSSAVGSNSTFGRTVYDKWAYTLTLEDVDADYAATPGIETNQVRMHIRTKKLDDILVGNMKYNSDTFKEVLLEGEERAPAVYDALEQIISTSENAEDAASNFDQLVGAPYASLAASEVRRISTFNTMMMDQIIASDICLKNIRQSSYGCPDGCGQCDACCNNRCWTAWGHIYADTGEVNMHNNLSGYNVDTYGAMFAIDWSDCESCHFGVYFNYSEMDLETKAQMGYTNMTSTDYSVGLYAKWLGLFCTGGYGSIIANVSWTDIDANRELYLDDNFRSDTSGIMPSLYYERGWIFFPNDKININPFFGLQYVYYHSEAFSEAGYDEVGDPSALALNVGDIDHHSLRTLVGLRMSRDWMLGFNRDRRITSRIKAVWMHDLLSECNPTVTTSHAAYPEFPIWEVKGNNCGRDWAILGLGVDFNASQRLSFLVDYNCYFNEDMTIHTGMATMRFSF